VKKSVIAGVVGFHLILTTVVYLVGRAALFPQFIDAGGLVVADSRTYQAQVELAATVMKSSGLAAWFFALLPFHVKLYSLSHLLSGWLFGSSILAIEPLNAALFLAVLYLVYKLSEEVFGRGSGLFAALIVGLWPSFLLYTTQPLRDPLFLVAALLFLLINTRWLTKTYSLPGALAVVAAGAAVECALWISRSDTWELMIGFTVITAALLSVRLLRERKLLWGNIIGALLMLALSLMIPRAAVQLYAPAYAWAKSYDVAFINYDDAQLEGVRPNATGLSSEPQAAYLPARIAALRERFITQYAGAGSNIDTEVRFAGAAGVIGYLPRAMMIGLFAPFPRMWFTKGEQTGRPGRLLGGAETLALYIIELMALFGLYHRRRELSVWLLFAFSITGATALGLVVTNVGALYRLRFVFVILLVILGCEGIRQTLSYAPFMKRRECIE
jgi:4-amino-4-deoxy-L-arabinose transferase-like glycosyltransferase